MPDPKNGQSLNRYSYVGNSPLRYVDPSGHAEQSPDEDETALLAYWKALAEKDSGRLDGEILEWLRAHQDMRVIRAMRAFLEKQFGNNTASIPSAFATVYATSYAGGSLASLGADASAALEVGALFRRVDISDVRVTDPGDERSSGRALTKYYPENDGFAGTPVKTTLAPGMIIDRYGGPGGTFASPQGTPPMMRSLPSGAEQKPLNTYKVMKALEVDAGTAAPWFNQPGGGVQYRLPTSVNSLVEQGYLEIVP